MRGRLVGRVAAALAGKGAVVLHGLNAHPTLVETLHSAWNDAPAWIGEARTLTHDATFLLDIDLAQHPLAAELQRWLAGPWARPVDGVEVGM